MPLLTDLQLEAAAQLSAQPFFADADAPAGGAPRPVAVLTEQRGDLQSRVRLSLAQQGIVCVVLTPTARMTNRNRQRPYFDEIRIVARTQENVVLNRADTGTGQPASLVAEAAAWGLHGYTPASLGCTLLLEEIRLVDDPRLLVYETVFTLQAGLAVAPARLR